MFELFVKVEFCRMISKPTILTICIEKSMFQTRNKSKQFAERNILLATKHSENLDLKLSTSTALYLWPSPK